MVICDERFDSKFTEILLIVGLSFCYNQKEQKRKT